jgi:(S)-ureidoglycine aminohydrolase
MPKPASRKLEIPYIPNRMHMALRPWKKSPSFKSANYMNRIFLLSPLLLSVTCSLFAQSEPVRSDVYLWNAFKSDQKTDREKKQILQGSTTFLESLEIHATTLSPGQPSVSNHVHPETEELVIVKEGQLKVTQNKTSRVLGPGSIALTLPGDEHSLENGGGGPVTYYVLNYKSKAPVNSDRGKNAGGSFMIDREDIPFKPHAKGGIRRYFERPTAMFERLEMHVTTLNEGLKSHEPHTHKADEIILLMSGDAEMQIDNDHIGATPGSLAFLNSMIPHALTNTGLGPCEYFAIQWQ